MDVGGQGVYSDGWECTVDVVLEVTLAMDSFQAAREVMTLDEIAEYLQVSQKSILRMAQTGKIPAAKVASRWRFMRSVVDDWLMAQMEIPSVRSAASLKDQQKLAPLPELMPPHLMNLHVTPDTKENVLRQLIEPMRKSRFLRQNRRFLQGLLERERLVSTAIGHGIAIPHPHAVVVGAFKVPAVAVGVCREGTDFAALDHQRTYVFFLLCAPSDDAQLRLIAHVIQVGRQLATIEKIKRATRRTAVTEILRAADGMFE